MGAMLQVEKQKEGEFRVTVIEGTSRTTHTVTVEREYGEKLTGGKLSAEELVRRSFDFLLEREPKESILRSFSLPVIGRYFPEYEREMKRRLGS
jgi:hypothetical protein